MGKPASCDALQFIESAQYCSILVSLHNDFVRYFRAFGNTSRALYLDETR